MIIVPLYIPKKDSESFLTLDDADAIIWGMIAAFVVSGALAAFFLL